MIIRSLFLLLLLSITVSAQTSKTEQAKKLYETKKYEEAKAILKKIDEDDKEYAEAQYYLGRVAFDQKEYDDAQDYFEDAVDANDKVANYHYWLGNTYGTIAGDANPLKQGMLAPKMRGAWEKAVALDPKLIGAHESLIQFYLQAPSFMGGSVDKAKAEAQQIMKINTAQGHVALGNVYVYEKKAAEAEKEYLEAIKVDGSFSRALVSFYVNQKLYDKAFPFFEEAIKKNPDDMGSVYQLGKLSALSGQKLDRGEECLKKYLTYKPKENEPSHAGANMRLAQIQEKRGNKAEAKKLYEVALKQDGTMKEAKEGLVRVSK